ncbi:MAG: dihydrofolate reductase family protein [Solirubrobacteraceae bacterium]
MKFARAVPKGPDGSPEELYTRLELERLAPDHRPYLICNFVASADGRATVGGRSGPLGGDGDRTVFHLLRTQTEAILAGTRTLRVERYGLLVEDEGMGAIREREGRARQPLAVIVSRSGEIPFDVPLFSDPGVRIALYGPPGLELPPACEARVLAHELTLGTGAGAPAAQSGRGEPALVPGGGVLATVLRSLRADHGVRSLLCEGGPTLLGALLVEDLVDELFLTLSPSLVGAGERTVTAGPALSAPTALTLVWALERDGHLFLRYARASTVPER